MRDQTTRQQVQRVLIITLILNLMVAAGKIVVGTMSGALSVTTDGFHSLMDGSSNVVGIVASRLAARPPDDDHPYGHRRYETLAALLIGAFLLVVAWEIATGAIARLQTGTLPEITPITLLVLLATLVVNVGVSTYQIRQGNQLQSELLLADAANTRTDVFITISVLVSVTIVAMTDWWWVDAAAALVVVVLIGRAAWRILSDTGRVLVDTAPYTPQRLTALLDELPSIQSVVRARSRGTPDAAHIDIDLKVAAAMTASQTEAIARCVRERLEDELTGISEVEVHFVPDHAERSSYALVARAAADALGLTTHEVVMIDSGRDRLLEMHVEVAPDQSLDTAHALVTQLEDRLTQSLPEVDTVVTHIEPAHRHAEACVEGDKGDLTRQVVALLRQHHPTVDWHDLRTFNQPDGLSLTMHAALTAEMSVAEAHRIAEDAETLIRAQMPEITRVTIHTEPFDHA